MRTMTNDPANDEEGHKGCCLSSFSIGPDLWFVLVSRFLRLSLFCEDLYLSRV